MDKKLLKEIISGKTKLIATVKEVSSSGMTRHIYLGYIGKDGYLCHLAQECQKAGIKQSKKYCAAIVMQGCGMDMVFHAIETLLYANGIKDAHKYAHKYQII